MKTNKAKSDKRRRQRERLRLLALMDRISLKLERDMRREIGRTMNRAAALVADGQSTDAATSGHSQRVKEILFPFYKRIAVVFIEDAANALKSSRGVEFKKAREVEGIVSRFLTEWVQEYGAEAVVAITRTTQKHIQNTVLETLRDGLSEVEAAKRIREASSMFSVTRSRTISRTESHRAAMAANNEIIEELPDDFVRVWVSASGRTRDAHLEADEQRVELKEPFIVDGEKLRYPGDPSGSPGNVINCRCVAVYEPR